MTIEVRQLLVKSTVTEQSGCDLECRNEPIETPELKAEILAECRQMLTELLARQKER